MVTDLRIVCLSSLFWNGRPSTWFHLVQRLARSNDILFVDPPRNLVRDRRDRAAQLHRETARITRLVPAPHLPIGSELRMRTTAGFNQRRYARAVDQAVRQLGWHAPVLWHSMPVYFAADVGSRIDPCLSFLHVTDSMWDYPGWSPYMEACLRRITDECAFTVATTDAIAGTMRRYRPPVHVLPQGVDVDLFAPVVEAAVAPTAAVADLPGPRFGFVGSLDHRLDVDALCALAEQAGSVVLVGPSLLPQGVRRRLEHAGCHLFAEVPYRDVPQWLAAFDVGIVPYLPTASVVASSPLKLLDFLAAGLPVVSVDIPAAAELSPAVVTATGGSAFAAAAARAGAAASAEGAEVRRRRAAIAAGYSWEHRASQLSDLIGDALASHAPGA